MEHTHDATRACLRCSESPFPPLAATTVQGKASAATVAQAGPWHSLRALLARASCFCTTRESPVVFAAMDGGKRKSGGTILSFFGAPAKRSKSSGGDDATAGAGAGEPGADAGALAVAEAGAGALAAPAEAPPAGVQDGGAEADAAAAGSALTVRTARYTRRRRRRVRLL